MRFGADIIIVRVSSVPGCNLMRLRIMRRVQRRENDFKIRKEMARF